MSDISELILQAKKDHVPVMMDSGMAFLLEVLRTHPEIMRILECGTAIGLSAIRMAEIRDNITIDTIEIDPCMYEQAKRNIQKAGLADRVFVHLKDASLYLTFQYYDLFFIDAAKSQYRMYLEHFYENSHAGSVFLFDNMNFHGIVDDPSLSENRSTLQMTRKILKFRTHILQDPRFRSVYYPGTGDGIVIAERI
ncbi:MAG: class I SAM-dependent methyltransferase [Solobacterium sp.]|nr:class I SAM-dependent methyltransferase [Solobacterium sp.]